MPRARLLVFALLSTIIAACSSGLTAPQQPRSGVNQKAARDSVPCDSTAWSGYSTTNNHHC